ncbi:uncharacterized protein LOC141850853 isoform X2 [Brevipalpus obovatus]|uniref:uncharacterized protein LOC141850853 isoform X2 n=1 Tax=Brevipalpus obovatus TaxID=246614 RepID=UPI003D9EC0A7
MALSHVKPKFMLFTNIFVLLILIHTTGSTEIRSSHRAPPSAVSAAYLHLPIPSSASPSSSSSSSSSSPPSTPLTTSTLKHNISHKLQNSPHFLNASLPTTIIYFVDFEILDYQNLEGRLHNGECCSGYKSTIGHGLCRGGNSSCHPYWKICMTFADENTRTGPTMMPSERRSLYRYEPHRNSLSLSRQPPPPPQQPPSRQSIFRSLLNRLMNTFRTTGSLDSSSSTSKLYSSNSTSSVCSVAYWSTEVMKGDIDQRKPIKLRARIPLVSMVKSFRSNSKHHSLARESPSPFPSSQPPVSPLSIQSIALNNNSPSPLFNPMDSNPIVQRLGLLVEIWHKQRDGDKLIARRSEIRNTTLTIMLPNNGDSWEESTSHGYIRSNHTGSGIRFKYRWRLVGDIRYPNSVSENTIKDCPTGFTGDECNEPICKKSCHPSHGYCSQPGECKCKFGWTGESCSICMPMPGCVHGSCNKPFECRCEEGWSGMFCDKPSCKQGCHPHNGYCEHPGECRCRFGYQGDNCTECAPMPGCQNGDCNRPLDCNCFRGWSGLFCSIPVCSDGCDLEHGWCKRPEECRCRIGWTGQNCTECVAYPGCLHGSCSKPWTCDCESGWGGVDCAERLDFCEKHSNPCKNGGSCISVEKSDGSFLCRCPLGFEGKNCEKTKRR